MAIAEGMGRAKAAWNTGAVDETPHPMARKS
jgi:hypothetical protein